MNSIAKKLTKFNNYDCNIGKKNKKTSPYIQAYTFLIVYVPYKINLQNFTQDMHVVCVCPRQNIFKKISIRQAQLDKHIINKKYKLKIKMDVHFFQTCAYNEL